MSGVSLEQDSQLHHQQGLVKTDWRRYGWGAGEGWGGVATHSLGLGWVQDVCFRQAPR